VVAAIAWGVTFGVLYIAFYGATAHSAYMRSFWEGTFLDPRAPDFILRGRMFAIAAFSAPTLTGQTAGFEWVMALAWAAGVWTLWRRRRVAGVIVAGPLALAAIACAVGRYAVMDRLFLFAAPLDRLCVLLAWVVDRSTGRRRRSRLRVPRSRSRPADARGPHFASGVLCRGQARHRQVDGRSRDEPVYIAARSFPSGLLHHRLGAPDQDRLRWAAMIARAGGPATTTTVAQARADGWDLSRRYAAVQARGHANWATVSDDANLNPSLTAVNTLPLEPDTGWAELEVSRMASAAHNRLWVFGSHMFALDGAEPALVAEMQRRGVRLIMERRQGSTVAYQVEFPGEP
jgi:hypothetical protein